MGDNMSKCLQVCERRCNTNFLKHNYEIVVLLIIFLFGLIVGTFSVAVCKDESFYGLDNYLLEYLSFLKLNGFITIFSKYLLIFVSLIIFNFLIGMCLLGKSILCFFAFVYSFGIGSVVSFVYMKYDLQGVLFTVFCLALGIFLFSINYLLSLRNSIVFSKSICQYCFFGNESKVDIKKYVLKYLVHIILCVFIAIVFAFNTGSFIERFNF